MFRLLIRDREGQPVEIDRVEADDPALTCRFAEGAWPTATVKVQVNKGQTPARSGMLRVLIRQPAPETLFVPVFGSN
jgi:riboflavin biosynthesis pyrimidine reductase